MEEEMKKPAGGLGVAALVLGIVSLVFCWMWIISIPCAIIGIVLGIVALIQKRKPGMPAAGLILSIVGGILSVVIIIWATSFVLKTIDNEIDNGILDYNNLYNYNYNNYLSSYSNNYANEVNVNLNSNTALNITNSTSNSSSTDKVSGYSFVEKSDNSLIQFNSNGSFKYYKDKNVLDDYYYEGIYEIYTGTSLKNWITTYGGDTLNSQYKETFEKMTDDQWNMMYVVELNNSKQIINGTNQLESPVTTYYVGTYDSSSNTLSIVNMKSAEIYNFVRQ